MTAKIENEREQGAGVDFEKTLDRSVLAEELVTESAKELADVNVILRGELQSTSAAPAVQAALDKSQAAEEKVNEASGHLSTVNTVLAEQLAGREELELRLVASQADEEAARAAALHDSLTGLANRSLLDDRLSHGIAQAARRSSMLALVFIDLDKFKRINDTYGHAAGDFVLKLIAQRLESCTRDVDTVSRHGGDEFLLVFPDLRSKDDLARIGTHIVGAIAEPCDLAAFGATVPVVVTASAGIAIYPQDGTDGAQLIRAADAAMYHAKKQATGLSFRS